MSGLQSLTYMMGELILVTGSSGRIGKAVIAELQKRGHAVRGFDRVPTPGVADMIVGTLTSEADVARAMAGVKTVIHLGATPDDADFLAEIVPNNIVGVYHVFEQAQKAGVKRMIAASSGQVVWYQRMTGRCRWASTCSRRRVTGMRQRRCFSKRRDARSRRSSAWR
jgi:nucleoside-diphosphate-sugar epimerase